MLVRKPLWKQPLGTYVKIFWAVTQCSGTVLH